MCTIIAIYCMYMCVCVHANLQLKPQQTRYKIGLEYKNMKTLYKLQSNMQNVLFLRQQAFHKIEQIKGADRFLFQNSIK